MAGALAARLCRCLAGEHHDQILADGLESGLQRAVEALAVGVKNHEAGHAPAEADDGEDAALPVEPEGLSGFGKNAL